ncbi:hypothetical protein QJS10_CPA09g01899 [Acorus calamus]|uniref:RNase H type-1 domain-containing protein n=1 Tax=Acorus calamus TaxID=4465 RepID=A0AAV9E5R6_ACOCL|nr:hypothetical protein QJS10_CPA09g01899 [Acorus calamus]
MPSASAFLRSDALTITRRSSIPAPRTTMWRVGVRMVRSETELTRSCVRCFASGRKRVARPPKADIAPSIDDEKDAFYVVRKGNLIGFYRSLSDCQEQLSPSVADPSVGVYKGYSLSKEAEEYLTSHGLRNAMYTIQAAHKQEDLLGTLVPCLPQGLGELGSTMGLLSIGARLIRTLDYLVSIGKLPSGSHKDADVRRGGHISTCGRTLYYDVDTWKISHCLEGNLICVDKELKKTSKKQSKKSKLSYSIEFDGASKGNPGKAGAGAIIRTADGTVVSGKWKAKSSNMIDLLAEAEELKNKFSSFRIKHVLREFNSEADKQANQAIDLPDGEVREVPE